MRAKNSWANDILGAHTKKDKNSYEQCIFSNFLTGPKIIFFATSSSDVQTPSNLARPSHIRPCCTIKKLIYLLNFSAIFSDFPVHTRVEKHRVRFFAAIVSANSSWLRYYPCAALRFRVAAGGKLFRSVRNLFGFVAYSLFLYAFLCCRLQFTYLSLLDSDFLYSFVKTTRVGQAEN